MTRLTRASAAAPLLFFLPAFVFPAELILRSGEFAFTIDPSTLRMEAARRAGEIVLVSAPAKETGTPVDLKSSETRASWKLSGTGLSVRASVVPNGLELRFKSSRARDFTWPLVHKSPPLEAFILPLAEGTWLPVNDGEMTRFLADRMADGELTEAFSMPFFGLDCAGATLTVIIETPLYVSVSFSDRAGSPEISFTRRFTRLDEKREHVFLILFGPDSLVEPAKAYRRRLIETGAFASLSEKMSRVPRASRLPGALHAYLWGFKNVAPGDIRKFPEFCAKLELSRRNRISTPAKKIWSLLGAEARKEVLASAEARSISAYSRDVFARELGRVMQAHSFHDPEAWKTTGLPAETAGAAGDWEPKTAAERVSFNSALLCSAFPEHFRNPEDWGDAISPRFIKRLRDSGVDRAVLIQSDLDEGDSAPEAARTADSLGFLYGTYDSYHSIHRAEEQDTWATAQFDDPGLYETGAITGPDGKFLKGFKGKGRLLSPLAARPCVEKRVNSKMKAVPFSAWFVDCDAAGQYFENHSKHYPHTREQDLKARLDRMDWIARTFDAPVGSETGSSVAARFIFFAHGMITPYFGWDDPDFKDKESPYHLGAYWPPEAPGIFFKQVPLKPVYRRPLFAAAFRLPLYEVVFHDSLAATHHWCFPSFKFTDRYADRALLEQLYNVPPLYHFTADEFERESRRILAHYRFFSPLHKRLALQPMTGFEWLSADRLVQKTSFGDGTEIFANFGGKEAIVYGLRIPGRSVISRRGGETASYSPVP